MQDSLGNGKRAALILTVPHTVVSAMTTDVARYVQSNNRSPHVQAMCLCRAIMIDVWLCINAPTVCWRSEREWRRLATAAQAFIEACSHIDRPAAPVAPHVQRRSATAAWSTVATRLLRLQVR